MKSPNLNWTLLITYIGWLLWETVFGRKELPSVSCEWQPFWTYNAIAGGRHYLIADVVNNVLMFMPVGFLMGITLHKRHWIGVVVVGVFISFTIELLQLYLHRGLCETDDIIHNTIGCFIGLIFASGMKRVKSNYL